jgi:hypothetical protein
MAEYLLVVWPSRQVLKTGSTSSDTDWNATQTTQSSSRWWVLECLHTSLGLLGWLMLAGLPVNSLPLVDLPPKHLLRNVMSIIRTEGNVVVGLVGNTHLWTERCLTFRLNQKEVQVRTSCTRRFGARYSSTRGVDAQTLTTVA